MVLTMAAPKRRPGRPEIGGRVSIALGPLLARIDAARGRTTRAAWLRSAAERALADTARGEIRAARTAKPDTEETPAMTVDREQLDPATAASLARGLAQSAAGQTVDLGDFTQYATDTEETP